MKQYESPKQLAKRLGTSESYLWRQVAAGVLPKPKKLTPGCSRFDSEEVDATIAAASAPSRSAANRRASIAGIEARARARAEKLRRKAEAASKAATKARP